MNRPFTADSLWVKDNVLKNKLNIKKQEELDIKEMEIVNNKLKNIKLNSFKKEDFINLHKYLYEDLYDFAGKLRDENVVLNGFMMCQYKVIDMCLTDLFNMEFKINNVNDMVNFLAYFYSELNVILPFRDGNEITIRFFLEEYTREKGYNIDINDISEKTIIEALKYAYLYDTSKLVNLFKEKIKQTA